MNPILRILMVIKIVAMLILIAVLLTACSPPISPKTYATAQEWCEPLGGLKHGYTEYFSPSRYTLVAVCQNGVEMHKVFEGTP